MKMSTSAVFLLSLGLALSGCVADMIAAERPRGTGTQSVIGGTPDEAREAFHHYIEKVNASQPNTVPPYVMTDGPDMSMAVNTNSVMGTTIIIRYKLFLSPGPKAGRTNVELLAEMPAAGGMNAPENLSKQEKAILDSISDSVELTRARKGLPPGGAAAPSQEQSAPDKAPWWK